MLLESYKNIAPKYACLLPTNAPSVDSIVQDSVMGSALQSATVKSKLDESSTRLSILPYLSSSNQATDDTAS